MRSFIIFILTIFVLNAQAIKLSNGLIYKKPTSNFRIGKTKLFNQIYVESGVKLSSNSDTIGNLHMGLLGLKHQLAKKFSLFHSYNYLSQDNFWGNVSQSNYYANFEYVFNNNFKLAFVGSLLNSNVRIAENILLGTKPEILKNNNYLALINATFSSKKIFFKPLFAYSQLNNLDSAQHQIQAGAELLFDIKGNDNLVFGFGVYHFINHNSTNTLIKPSLAFNINDEINISADYFFTNTVNYSDQNAFVIYNSVDKSIDRTNINLRYEFANNTYLFCVYQFERKQDHISLTNYNFNSIFLGIKYNL